MKRWETRADKERELARRLGSPPTGAEWQLLGEWGLRSHDPWDSLDMREAVDYLRRVREAEGRAGEEWEMLTEPRVRRLEGVRWPPNLAMGEGERVLSVLEALREDVLGITAPALSPDFSLEEYEELLRALAREPAPPDYEARLWVRVSQAMSYGYSLEGERFEVAGVEAPRSSKLAYLMRAARWLALATGISPMSILLAVLTDYKAPRLPWTIEAPRFRLVVYPRGQERRGERRAKKRLVRKLIQDFFARRPGIPWDEALREWNEEHGAVRWFPTVESLRKVAYRAGVRRRQP